MRAHLVALLLAVLTVGSVAGDELSDTYERALELFRAERYEEALPHFERALELAESRYGADDPAIAVELNNLAEIYRQLGRYDEALPLYERALALDRKRDGDEAGLATTLNNLALLYRAQGQLEEAEPLYLRSLDLLEKALGPNHPDIAKSLNNLAVLYRGQGHPGRAREMLERALGIARASLAPDHPTRQTLERNLALLDEAATEETVAGRSGAEPAAGSGHSQGSSRAQGSPRAKSDGGYFIHLASVRSAEAADQEWQRLSDLLDLPDDMPQRPPERVEIDGQGTFYRVAGGDFTTREAAADFCAAIKAQGQYCAVMARE